MENEPEKVDVVKQFVHRSILKDLKEIANMANTEFWGYQKGKNMMPPKELNVLDGRGNPQYIRYLYLADSDYTALVEIRPNLGSLVNIAEIINKEDLSIVDFSYDNFGKDCDFYFFIMQEFSEIYKNELKQYLPTQYITELIKKEGFDGIKYNSSLSNGRNFLFFSEEKFDDIASKVFKVERIMMDAKCENASNIPNVSHPQLRKGKRI